MGHEEEGLDLLRSAMYFFPRDEEIVQSAHYLRNNINRDCPLFVRQTVPDLPLHYLPSSSSGPRSIGFSPSESCSSALVPTSLHKSLRGANYSVLVAGSHT